MKSWEMKVKSITKIERSKETEDIVIYKLLAKNKDDTTEIVISSAEPFIGFSAKDSIITVKLENSQLSIEDFEDV